jgi:hypothetical protein
VSINEIVAKGIGKTAEELSGFFNGLVSDGHLRAYRVDVQKKTRQYGLPERKGATLVPIARSDIPFDSDPFILEDPTTGLKYNLRIESRGGDADADSNRWYYDTCIIERLGDNLDLGQIEQPNMDRDFWTSDNHIEIPSTMITGRLEIEYNTDYNARTRSRNRLEKRTTATGANDALFRRVTEFLRDK